MCKEDGVSTHDSNFKLQTGNRNSDSPKDSYLSKTSSHISHLKKWPGTHVFATHLKCTFTKSAAPGPTRPWWKGFYISWSEKEDCGHFKNKKVHFKWLNSNIGKTLTGKLFVFLNHYHAFWCLFVEQWESETVQYHLLRIRLIPGRCKVAASEVWMMWCM